MALRIPAERSRQLEKDAWELRQKGWVHQRIADELGYERSSVTKALKRVLKRVVKQLDDDVRDETMSQIGQLRFIVDEGFQAWEESKAASKQVRQKRIQTAPGATPTGNPIALAPDEITTQVSDNVGDTKYLTEARNAMADLRKLLGINAATKFEIAGTDGGPLEFATVTEIIVELPNEPMDT